MNARTSLFGAKLHLLAGAVALMVSACGSADDPGLASSQSGSAESSDLLLIAKAELAAGVNPGGAAPGDLNGNQHPYSSPAHFVPNMGRSMPPPRKINSYAIRSRAQLQPYRHDENVSSARSQNQFTPPSPASVSRSTADELRLQVPGTAGGVTQCDVNFDDEWALSNVYREARDHYGRPTTMLEDFSLAECSMGTDESCWIYRQRCGPGFYVRVEEPPEEPQAGHLHLGFATFGSELPCFIDPGDGLGPGYARWQADGSCQALDWAREPRILQAHTYIHRTRLWLKEWFSNEPRMFNAVSLTITNSSAAELRIKRNGQWYEWSSVAPGQVNLSNWAWGITDLYLGTSGNGGPSAFNGIVITR